MAKLRLIIHSKHLECDGLAHEDLEVLAKKLHGCGWPPSTRLMVVRLCDLGDVLADVRLKDALRGEVDIDKILGVAAEPPTIH